MPLRTKPLVLSHRDNIDNIDDNHDSDDDNDNDRYISNKTDSADWTAETTDRWTVGTVSGHTMDTKVIYH